MATVRLIPRRDNNQRLAFDDGFAVDGTAGTQGDALPQGFDEHDFEGAQELSVADQQELARDIDEAVRQGALIAGKMGSGGDRDLQDLLQPQVDWREVMRDFITTTCTGSDYSTWKRPNRRNMAWVTTYRVVSLSVLTSW